ncbi:MAG: glycosyltransferase family 4 protein [Deltaproteobacteria bacterium]|nr:glycosyltransferase family 4 protein [Deltaproteobacteria bacterium]
MSNYKKIAVIGNYLPRRCGIATFTTDLCNAIAGEMECGGNNLVAIAMDDVEEGYHYKDRVKFQVKANVLSDYLCAAGFLNLHKFDVALLQHEFGIFGGSYGAHIIHMLKNLRMPVITTLHTVLENPTEEQRIITGELARHSEALVVMAHKAHSLLMEVYGIDEGKIVHIPHGIPDVKGDMSLTFRRQLGLDGRRILLTFGLLSPGKGIEGMINAMPAILKEHPHAVFIILGETHPHIKKEHGDSYRQSLFQQVRRLGLKDNVLFHNRFVDLDTLTKYITSADIYVSPYLNREQIVSGTLAYAMGLGTAIVATPYWYAEELLADGRGVIVPFGCVDSMSKEICALLKNEKKRSAICKKGYTKGRSMVWQEVGKNYLALTCEALKQRSEKPIQQIAERSDARIIYELPEVNLKIMTDDTGMLQHAKYSVPDRHHGYCVDDNARALIVAGMHYSLFKDKSVIPLMQTYLSFMHYSFNPEKGSFRNFMSYDRRWLEEAGSEDSQGRSIWGLGVAVKCAPNEAVRNMAASLFLEGLNCLESFVSPRALSFAILGLHAYMEVFGGDANARRLRQNLSEKLFALFAECSSKDWPWCEEIVTYANGKIPHALILSGQWIPDPEMHKAGLTALEWLLEKQTAPEEHLSIIGNSDWLNRDGRSAIFDQQPIEVMCLIEACAEAFRSTADRKWMLEAKRCLGWFLGWNDLGEQVCVLETGGCFDGIEAIGVNANQGAESTLSWLISLLTMYEIMVDGVLVER